MNKVHSTHTKAKSPTYTRGAVHPGYQVEQLHARQRTLLLSSSFYGVLQMRHLSCARSCWLLRLPKALGHARPRPGESASHQVHGHKGPG